VAKEEGWGVKRSNRETAASSTRKAVAMLRSAADRRVAEQSLTYFKAYDRVAFVGIRAPKVREIERKIFQAVKPSWSLPDALLFADSMIRSKYLEAKAVGLLLLSRYGGRYEESLLTTIHGWLADGHCSNWATTDLLSTSVLKELLRRYPHLLVGLKTWTVSESLWVRRAAAVSLTPLARRGEHLDTAYSIAGALLDDPEDLMHKAVGWLLRECGRTDARRLEAFLMAEGGRIPRTALRYAIEHFPTALRKRILEETKQV
jgi:3-methyladenine DNA glycosylase AlkD